MIRVRSIAAQLAVLLFLVGGLVIADGDHRADAAFAVNCDEDGSLLIWPDLGADGDRYHVRKLKADGSSTWVATTRNARSYQLAENGPDDSWIIRFRLDGVVNDLECIQNGGGPAPVDAVTCWQYGSALMWSTPDADIIDDVYSVRRSAVAGTVFVKTIDAVPAIAGPDAIQNVALGFDRNENYSIRFWVEQGGEEVPVTAPCRSWFQDQPVGPGAFVSPCAQTDHVLVWNDMDVDRDLWHARTADGSKWIATYGPADVERDGRLVAAVLPTANDVSLRWRENRVKVDSGCDTRF